MESSGVEQKANKIKLLSKVKDKMKTKVKGVV